MVGTVVWATDGSDFADAALEEVQRLEPERIVAVHCTQRHRLHGAAHEIDGTACIDAKVAQLRDQGLDVQLVTRLTHGAVAEAVAEIAGEVQADLVVCGTRGRGAVSGAIHGSVSQRLPHLVHCPLLVVPPRLHDGDPHEERTPAQL